MPKAIIFIGIPACGKTSYYNQFFSKYVHINLDTLKTRNREKILLTQSIMENKDFVIDNTNPCIDDRLRYIQPAAEAGYKIIGYYFRSSVLECIERNCERTGTNRIPDKAVATIHSKLVIPSMSEGFDKLFYVKLTENGFHTEEWRDEM